MADNTAMRIVVHAVLLVWAAHQAVGMFFILRGVGRGPSSEHRAPASVTNSWRSLREEGLEVAYTSGGLDPGFALKFPKAQLFSDNLLCVMTGVLSDVFLDPALGALFLSVV